MSKDFQESQVTGGAVSKKAATPGYSRAEGIARILGILKPLEGMPDAKTVIEDERKNLEAFLTESHPGFESLAAEVKAILK